MVRHTRLPTEVIERARLIGELVLEESDLPDPNYLDPDDIAQWAAAASADPYREGALRFELQGHDVLVRYRPATDRLTVSTWDSTPLVAGTLSEPGAALSPDDAALRAKTCLHELEAKGVLGTGEFSDDYHYSSARPTYVEGAETASVSRYKFIYHPNLDGLPLTSTELIIGVHAASGRCLRVTVSGQVALTRVGDASIELDDESRAQEIINEKVAMSAPGPLADVHVYGHFGYYLPMTSTSATIAPSYIANYATQTGTAEHPILSRRKLVGLPLVDPLEADLVELLGPGW